MKKLIFHPGQHFQNNALYLGSAAEYHIRLEDTSCPNGVSELGLHSHLQVALVLDNLENVTIDLQGAKLVFHGRIAPFLIRNCRNVTLTNFSIDYDRTFYSQASVVEVTAAHIRLHPDPEFSCGDVNGAFCALAPCWTQALENRVLLMQPFDSTTSAPAYLARPLLASFGNPLEEDTHPWPITILHHSTLPDGDWEWTGNIPVSWQAGQTLVFSHEPRDKNAFLASHCSGLRLENIRLHHCAAMGLRALFCHNLIVRRFDMFRDCHSRGMVTCNADSIHCFHCTGKVLIEDCIFENMLDDAVNVHGNYTRIESVHGLRLQCICPGAAEVRGIHWFSPGDRLAVHRGATAEVKSEATVASVKYLRDGHFLLALACPSTQCEPGDILEHLSGPELTIRGCLVGRNRPRGFLLSSSGKMVVEGCIFRTASCAIDFTADMNYWFESGPVRDVSISNNFFLDCNYADRSGYPIRIASQIPLTPNCPYTHSGIVISGNVFENSSGRLLQARDAKNIVFRDNRFVFSSKFANVPGDSGCSGVVLDNCRDCLVTLPGNLPEKNP